LQVPFAGLSSPGVLLLSIAILSFLIVLVTYLLYFTIIYRNTDHVTQYLTKLRALQQLTGALPKVSIIVSAYNEAKVIRRKIQNIAALDYPPEQIEVIVLDDCSQDATGDIAAHTLKEYRLNGRVIRTPTRLGLNQSLNHAFQEARHPYICVTDSDVTLETKALKNAVTVLAHFDDAGGVTGRIVPVHHQVGVATNSESDYRVYYDRSMLTESAFHSAFPGNGPLIIFKSFPHASIPVNYGATDANIVMNVIKQGKRLLYIPNAIIYEPVPETLSQQRLQKVRRATRLIQAFIHNTDVFLNGVYGRFGQLIFPLKFLLHVLCPLLLVAGVLAFIPFITLYASPVTQFIVAGLLGVAVVVVARSRKIRSFVLSFLFHQIYLVLGLVSLPRQSRTWTTIDRR
jgi:cellulose synthase/poly-beta-1,6-N-acetylglucosamine synthase-like glycosyltransferase